MKPKSNGKPSSAKSGAGDPGAGVPFSRLVSVDPLPDEGFEVEIEADAEERKGARGFGRAGRYRKTRVTEEVDVDFTRLEDIENAASERAKRERAMPRDQAKFEEEDEDPPDPIIDGKIDLGALAGEFLALVIDPYPKKPGVSFDEIITETPEERESPFAILRKWDKTS